MDVGGGCGQLGGMFARVIGIAAAQPMQAPALL
jgi:hypothetical protein